MSHDKIATRLACILTKLNNGESFTVNELAKEFEVKTRTIQRDLKERLIYLPIVKKNKYYSMESYALGKLNFEDIKAELKVDLIMLLAKHGYPPITKDEVFKEIFEQAENFKRFRKD